MWRVYVRLAAATAVAAAVVIVLWRLLPSGLSIRTDVVGYATFFDYDYRGYFRTYELVAGLFPLLALLLFVVATRGVVPVPASAARLSVAVPGRRSAGLRLAFGGSVLGVEAAAALGRGVGFAWVATVLLPVALAYAAAVFGIAAVLRAPVAAVNAFGAILPLLGLWAVSHRTTVHVAASGATVAYPWLPLGLALALAAGAAAAAAVWLRRRGQAAASVLEARMLLLVAAPVCVFVVHAQLRGELGPINSYEEGLLIGGAHLTLAGAFPWRDIFLIHGLLPEVAQGALAFHVFGDTRWGFWAGRTLLYEPLFWVSLYFLCAYLFRRDWRFLIATQLAIVLAVLPTQSIAHDRFTPLPFAFLLLAALLERATWPRAVALAALLTAHVTAVPEAAFAVPGIVVAVAVAEWYGRSPGTALAASFPRTLRLLAAGAACVAVLFAILAANGAVGAFLFWWQNFGFGGYDVATGIPRAVTESRGYYVLGMVAPVAVWLVTVFVFAIKIRLRQAIRVDEWVVLALGLTAGIYYRKFLGRADSGHAYEVLAVTLPGLFYWLYRAVAPLDRLARAPLAGWAAIAAVVAAAVVLPGPSAATLRSLPARLHAQAVAHSPVPRVGYAAPGDVDEAAVADLRTILDAYVPSGAPFFDFTNDTAVFHYLLGRETATRYYQVMEAFNRPMQDDLVRELERTRPRLVAYRRAIAGYGMNSVFDGIPNDVRHYRVSSYLLSHYRPFLSTHGVLLLSRNDLHLRPPDATLLARLHEAPRTSALAFDALPCTWGTAPNFLELDGATGGGVSLPAVPIGGETLRGWAFDTAAGRLPAGVVAAVGQRVVAETQTAVERPDVAAQLGPEAQRAGYELLARAIGDLRVYALTHAGTAMRLQNVHERDIGAPGPHTLVLQDGRRVPVVETGAAGYVEAAVAAPAWRVVLPPRPQRFGRLRLALDGPAGDTGFVVSDHRADATLDPRVGVFADPRQGSHAILFASLARIRRPLVVDVGACPQWHAYGAGPLYVFAQGDVRLTAVRLLP